MREVTMKGVGGCFSKIEIQGIGACLKLLKLMLNGLV